METFLNINITHNILSSNNPMLNFNKMLNWLFIEDFDETTYYLCKILS
jgi:hypothetical protein